MGYVEKRVEWQKRVIKRQVLLDADPMATLATLFVQKLLTSVLDWEEDMQPPEIDRARRALIPRPNPGVRPPMILVRFLRSADRELILRTARNKPELSWEGNHIMISLDFSRATQRKRDKFRNVRRLYTSST